MKKTTVMRYMEGVVRPRRVRKGRLYSPRFEWYCNEHSARYARRWVRECRESMKEKA